MTAPALPSVEHLRTLPPTLLESWLDGTRAMLRIDRRRGDDAACARWHAHAEHLALALRIGPAETGPAPVPQPREA